VPSLKRDDGVIIDDLSAHCVAGVRELIEAAGDVVAIELFGVSREIALPTGSLVVGDSLQTIYILFNSLFLKCVYTVSISVYELTIMSLLAC
jgi:hypothetical protein